MTSRSRTSRMKCGCRLYSLPHTRSDAGFTLIELMIAITLVAALATGMLMAMRTSLLSMGKINGHLEFNRRVMGMQRVLSRQIGGAMPSIGDCGEVRMPVFSGASDSLRLVSSYSMNEGARGYPQFDQFTVVKGEQGVRLIVTEHPFTGPASTAPFCGEGAAAPDIEPTSLILADRLASCTFSYRERIPDTYPSEKWLPVWDRPDMPAAVKIEMTPLDGNMAVLRMTTVTVPIHVTREVRSLYEDIK